MSSPARRRSRAPPPRPRRPPRRDRLGFAEMQDALGSAGSSGGVWAVLVAAGRGERLAADPPEAFVRLGERGLLAGPPGRPRGGGLADARAVVAAPAGGGAAE